MTLTERLENLLTRQIEWFEEALAWYAKLDSALGTEAYEALLTQLEVHGKAIDAFKREREILEKELAERSDASLPSTLKPLVDRASVLAKQLGEVQASAAERTSDAAQRIQDELGTLQRGRRTVLDGYRAGEAEGVQWLDRKG